MRLSREWLSDFLSFEDISDERFCELVTTRVAEVDAMSFPGRHAKAARIVKIEAVEAHPKRSNLCVAVVRVQPGEAPVTVVCGAPNVRAGMFAVYLAPGAQLSLTKADDAEQFITVEVRQVDGVSSTGVLVSERELGLSPDHSGIVEVSSGWLRGARRGAAEECAVDDGLIGRLLDELVPCVDTVLEIDNKSLTHRPDLWCHFGFARELAAILNRPLRKQIDDYADGDAEGAKRFAAIGSGTSDWKVEIAAGSGCRRFTALEISGVAVQPSPLWLRRRLYRVGAGVRNVIVDLSNYVMHDIGQPNHTYDADVLQGKTITVRRAADGEVFRALDGEDRKLCAEDIVIADASGVIGLGGVMGGATASVSDTTSRLLLENANFNPVTIRKTTVRYALRTDASNRFEKSQSAFSCAVGVQRFVELLSELQPAVKTVGQVVQAFVERPAAVSVPLRGEYIRARVGAGISDEQIEQMLTGLGFTIQLAEDGAKSLNVPYYRATRDISIEDDLVEEVGRVFGYENVPEQAPKISSIAAPIRRVADFEATARELLCGMGFSEAYQYSFMNARTAAACGYETKNAIQLQNPVDADLVLIRTSLVPGMIEALERNQKHTSQVLLFELGRGYDAVESAAHAALQLRVPVKNPAAFERRLLSLVYASGKSEAELAASATPALVSGADFFALAGACRRLVNKVARVALELQPLSASGADGVSEAADYFALKAWMHPYRAASLSVNGKAIGVIAEISPMLRDDRQGRAVVAELDIELLLEADPTEPRFTPLSKYPDSFFEVSVVAPSQTYARELASVIEKSVQPRSLLRKIETISVYEGKPLAEGEKSVSFKLYLGAEDRTLSGEDLQTIQNQVMRAIPDAGYRVRC